MESAVVETTDTGDTTMEEGPQVAKEELTSAVPEAPPESTGKLRTHRGRAYLKMNTKKYFIICMTVCCN